MHTNDCVTSTQAQRPKPEHPIHTIKSIYGNVTSLDQTVSPHIARSLSDARVWKPDYSRPVDSKSGNVDTFNRRNTDGGDNG